MNTVSKFSFSVFSFLFCSSCRNSNQDSSGTIGTLQDIHEEYSLLLILFNIFFLEMKNNFKSKFSPFCSFLWSFLFYFFKQKENQLPGPNFVPPVLYFLLIELNFQEVWTNQTKKVRNHIKFLKFSYSKL
jgi:hypothetical protein